MKSLKEVIQEAKDDVRWIAIEVVTENPIDDYKTVRTQRVVSLDTYREMKDKGHTKSHMPIISVDKLSPECRTREAAMEYLDQPKREKRKSAINKGGADYIVYAISNGQLKSSGDTANGWNIWEDGALGTVELYTERGGYFLYGAKGSLKVGDTICIVDNDTHKKLCTSFKKVEHILPCDSKENFIEAYRKTFPNYCKKPTYAFGRRTDGIPWSSFGPTYSIKGISE
jgi:hypothetical protein